MIGEESLRTGSSKMRHSRKIQLILDKARNL